MSFIVHIKPTLILGRYFPHEYIVLSSAKLQISDFSTKKKISLMNILNKNNLILSHVISLGKFQTICYAVEPLYSGHPIWRTPCYSGQIFLELAESRSNSHIWCIADTIFRNRVIICLEIYLSIAERLILG